MLFFLEHLLVGFVFLEILVISRMGFLDFLGLISMSFLHLIGFGCGCFLLGSGVCCLRFWLLLGEFKKK